jgi:hypothetical protein
MVSVQGAVIQPLDALDSPTYDGDVESGATAYPQTTLQHAFLSLVHHSKR